MRTRVYSLIIFSAKFVVGMIALAPVPALLAPLYSQMLAMQASWLLPEAIVSAEGHTIVIDQDPLTAQFQIDSMLASVLLLVALFLATPRIGFKQRTLFLGIALLLQIAYHLLDITLSFQNTYHAAVESHQKEIYRLTNLFGGLLERVFPVMIWALFTFRYWLPKPAAPAAPPSPQPQRHPKEARP